jgi:hypothetical protein
MVLDKGQLVRGKQLQYLKDNADPDVFALTGSLVTEMEHLHLEHRLPLIDIAIPTLKQLSVNQYKLFRKNLVELIELDDKIDLMEWSLQKILFNHLDGEFFKPAHIKARYSHLGQLNKETALGLSVMAHAGHEDPNDARAAFNAAASSLQLEGLQMVEQDKISFSVLDHALARLTLLKPLVKPQLLKACAISVIQDGKISPVEVELIRTFSDVLDCPMPPINL